MHTLLTYFWSEILHIYNRGLRSDLFLTLHNQLLIHSASQISAIVVHIIFVIICRGD